MLKATHTYSDETGYELQVEFEALLTATGSGSPTSIAPTSTTMVRGASRDDIARAISEASRRGAFD